MAHASIDAEGVAITTATRNSYATHMLEDRVLLRLIQEYLGHISPKTTALYTHLTKQVHYAATEPVNCLMHGL